MRATKFGRLTTIAAASAVVAMAITGCQATPSEPVVTEEPTALPGSELCPDASTTGDISITVSSRLTVFAPLLVADYLGEFEKAGINLKLEKVAAVDAVPLLGQGQIDGSATSYSAFYMNAVNAGIDLQWIAPFDTQLEIKPGDAVPGYWARTDVVGTDKVPNLKALKGETIGSPTMGTGTGGLILQRALTSQGLDFSDVKMTRLVTTEALAALQNGAVAATWISAPLEIEAAKDPNLRFIAGYAPGVTGSGIVVGPKLLDRPQLLVKFLQVLSNTIEQHLDGDYRQDPTTVAILVQSIDGAKPEIIKESALLYFDPTLPFAGADEFLGELQAFLIGQGGLEFKTPLPADKLYDSSFAEAAMTCSRDWMKN